MLLFHVISVLQILTICLARKTFEAYRVLQYEKNQKSLGSRKLDVDHLVGPIFGDHDLGRNIGIISIEYLTLEILQSLSYRRCQSLLIILPTIATLYQNETFYQQFNEIEQYLLTNSFEFSIFFAFNDNDIINDLLLNANDLFNKYGNKDYKINLNDLMDPNDNTQKSQLMGPFAMHDMYQLKGSDDSEPINSVKYTNLFSKIISKNADKYIVITANHDSYGVVPNLAFGVNDNGSGITSIMSLINLFYKLYEKASSDNTPNYNLLFLLTAGGYTNYKGTTKWIEDTKGGKTLLNDIEMVLCIDSIGIGQELFLYTTQQFVDDQDEINKKYKNVKYFNYMKFPDFS